MSIGLSLTDAQRRMIEDIKRDTLSRIEGMRCRIILLLDEKVAVTKIAKMVDCVRSTVYTTIYRFEDDGLTRLATSACCQHHAKPLEKCARNC